MNFHHKPIRVESALRNRLVSAIKRLDTTRKPNLLIPRVMTCAIFLCADLNINHPQYLVAFAIATLAFRTIALLFGMFMLSRRRSTRLPDVPPEWGNAIAVVVHQWRAGDEWHRVRSSLKGFPRARLWPVCVLAAVTLPAIVTAMTAGKQIALDTIVARTVGCVAYFAVSLWLSIKVRFPRRTSTWQSTISLYRGGYADIVSSLSLDGSPAPGLMQSGFVPWGRIKEIKLIDGDVFFVNKVTRIGTYITRRAFADLASARDFVRVADELRMNALTAPNLPSPRP